MAATTTRPYSTLAEVYEWLVPEGMVEPEGAAAAFSDVLDTLEPGARVLDCAAGTGQLAVGTALRGFEVVATDASPAMVDRARSLAQHRGAAVRTDVCDWEGLAGLGLAPFDAVLCVGNSLTHAVGRRGRRAALAAMRAVLRPGGWLAVTSRNWEKVRAAGSGLEVADRLVTRAGRSGLVIHAWDISGSWDDPHHLDVAVALVSGDGGVTARTERLAFWPFRHAALREDLIGSGLTPVLDTYRPDAERYLVTARRR